MIKVQVVEITDPAPTATVQLVVAHCAVKETCYNIDYILFRLVLLCGPSFGIIAKNIILAL